MNIKNFHQHGYSYWHVKIKILKMKVGHQIWATVKKRGLYAKQNKTLCI